jgi:hypothetical protein
LHHPSLQWTFMTTEAKKQAEERYARMLLDGLCEYDSIERGPERPDLWVRRSPTPDIALEVTEYHPLADGWPGSPRREVESRWWDGLAPAIEQERRARPALQDVRVRIGFKDARLPRRRVHAPLAAELVRLVEVVVPELAALPADTNVVLLAREDLARVPARAGNILFRAAEDWSLVAEHVSFLRACRWFGLRWPPWGCPESEGAWPSPVVEQLRRDLQRKADAAKGYQLDGARLWLLLVSEVDGDLQSHIFPRTDDDMAGLRAAVEATGFDFQNGPFSEVWLLSAFSGGRLRLHPCQS